MQDKQGSGYTNDHTSVRSPHAVMLTADRKIDRRILLEAASLDKAGWQVTILAMPSDDPITEQGLRIFRVNQGFGVGEPRRENVIWSGYRIARRLLPMNGRIMTGLKHIVWRYLVDPECYYLALFRDAALQFPADVYVAHDLPMLPVARFAAEHFGARVIYDSHELYWAQEFSPYLSDRWSEVEMRHIGAATEVITVNESIAQELRSRYSINNVSVIYNADDVTWPPPQNHRLFHTAFGLNDNARIVLFQGGISANRNLELLVDSVPLWKDQAAHLVFLGDGVLVQRLRSRVKRRRVEHRVHFHPAVAQQELLTHTACADLGLIPYQAVCLNNYYCTPNKLFEYIAAAVPVLASDLPELRRFIVGYRIGLVGDTASAAGLARLVDEALSDHDRLSQFRERALEVRNEVNWASEAKHLIAIFARAHRANRVMDSSTGSEIHPSRAIHSRNDKA